MKNYMINLNKIFWIENCYCHGKMCFLPDNLMIIWNLFPKLLHGALQHPALGARLLQRRLQLRGLLSAYFHLPLRPRQSVPNYSPFAFFFFYLFLELLRSFDDTIWVGKFAFESSSACRVSKLRVIEAINYYMQFYFPFISM